MSTKADLIATPNSCWNRADGKEPLFVLRSNDPTAPSVVRAWANAYVFDKGGLGQLKEHQIEKYNNALQVANDMENWRRLAGRFDMAVKR